MGHAHHHRIALLAATAPLLALQLAGCVDTHPEAGRPCPCSTGNVCCSSGVCAPDGDHCGAATLALAAENAGTWTGYLENFNLPSGSDALKIAINVNDAAVSGTFVLGTAAAPPPPTDVMTPWPPGSPPIMTFGSSGLPLPPIITDDGIVEGAVYQARDIVWENLRVKFKVALGEAWQPLCDLYAANPITVGNETFVCPPSWGAGAGQCKIGEITLTDAECQRLLAACNGQGRCLCNTTTCTPTAGDLSVDVALHDDRGDGSVAGAIQANVRLMRTGH